MLPEPSIPTIKCERCGVDYTPQENITKNKVSFSIFKELEQDNKLIISVHRLCPECNAKLKSFMLNT